MSPKMANMAPKTTQDRVQVGTKIEKKIQEDLNKHFTKKVLKKCSGGQQPTRERGGGPFN